MSTYLNYNKYKFIQLGINLKKMTKCNSILEKKNQLILRWPSDSYNVIIFFMFVYIKMYIILLWTSWA